MSTRWRMPPGQLEGILGEDAARLPDVDRGEQRLGHGEGLAPVEPQMKAQMVGHLRGDPAHRVERGHRVLRHHGEEAAEEGAAAARRGRQQILAVERDRAFCDPDAGRQDAQDRAAEQRLARARFNDDAVHLARRHGEGDAAQQRMAALAHGRSPEIADLEERRHRTQRVVHCRMIGSKSVRNPSPSALKPSTTMTTQLIGSAISHQAWLM